MNQLTMDAVRTKSPALVGPPLISVAPPRVRGRYLGLRGSLKPPFRNHATTADPPIVEHELAEASEV